MLGTNGATMGLWSALVVKVSALLQRSVELTTAAVAVVAAASKRFLSMALIYGSSLMVGKTSILPECPRTNTFAIVVCQREEVTLRDNYITLNTRTIQQ